jgi:outer membrane protein OmpA-like peptidoglycan-associated protein
MKQNLRSLVLAAVVAGLALPLYGQFKDPSLGGGIGFGGTFGATELKDNQAKFLARAFLRYPLVSHLQGELGAALGKVAGPDYSTQIIPIDYRFVLSPFSFDSWNPYIYAGAGALHYDVETVPDASTPDTKLKGWTGVIPGGLGVQLRLDDRVSFDVNGGYNYTFAENLDGVKSGKKDAYWNFLAGLTVSGESPDADPDGDGLTNREEKQLGTDPHKADTDGDGLSDGDEVHKYKTNPLKADSDGDGLSDGDEVMKYKTDPNKADTDGDGLNDGDEVMKYKTDPLKADTDGDGLSDGDEVLKYKTDPLKADTDGDGLSDGDEVLKYKTDPLKKDTDGGGVDDGAEVARGSNPLDPADDMNWPPKKKEELTVEVGKAIVLEGVVFKTGKAEITPESEQILTTAYNTLAQNPDIAVEIQGHTDNSGKRASNMKLSQARADAVKAWLVAKGIDAGRITTKGYGPDKPAASNKTAAGKEKNRRIEFFRTK